MQISWYKSDRLCSKEGQEFEKDQNYLTHLVGHPSAFERAFNLAFKQPLDDEPTAGS